MCVCVCVFGALVVMWLVVALACREEVLARFCMLRQQAEKESDDPYLSQADFIAPKVGWAGLSLMFCTTTVFFILMAPPFIRFSWLFFFLYCCFFLLIGFFLFVCFAWLFFFYLFFYCLFVCVFPPPWWFLRLLQFSPSLYRWFVFVPFILPSLSMACVFLGERLLLIFFPAVG